MASIDFAGASRLDEEGTGRAAASTPRQGPPLLARLWSRSIQHFKVRRGLVAISRLGPHLIRDIGLEPEQIDAALAGSWDEVDLARYLDRPSGRGSLP